MIIAEGRIHTPEVIIDGLNNQIPIILFKVNIIFIIIKKLV